MQVMAHVGIALATAASAWLNASLLAVTLHRRGQLRIDARLRSCAPRILLAALCMAAVLWAGERLLAPVLADGTVEKAMALAVLVAGGLATYGIIAQLTGAARLGDLRASLRRK